MTVVDALWQTMRVTTGHRYSHASIGRTPLGTGLLSGCLLDKMCEKRYYIYYLIFCNIKILFFFPGITINRETTNHDDEYDGTDKDDNAEQG